PQDAEPAPQPGASYGTPSAESEAETQEAPKVEPSGQSPAPAKARPAPAKAAAAPAAPAAKAAPAKPSAAASALRGKTEKMTRLRALIAKRMVESLQVSAQLTTVVEIDVTKIAQLRNRAKNDFL